MSKADRFRSLSMAKDEQDITNPSKSNVIDEILGAKNESTKNISNNTTESNINEETNNQLTHQSEPQKTTEAMNKTIDTEEYDGLVTRNSFTEQSYVSKKQKKPSVTKIPSAIEEFEKRVKRPTVEETHTRATWLVRNDLLKRLEKLAKNQQRGFKTHVINYAIERVLDEIEGK